MTIKPIYGFFILLVLLCLTVLPFWQSIGMQPMLVLLGIYHWSIYRSEWLSPSQLILLSILMDGLYAYPLGLSAARLLIDFMILSSQKRMLSPQNFIWVWGGFSLFILVDTVLLSGLLSIAKGEWAGLFPLCPGSFLTILLYPLFVYFANKLPGKDNLSIH